MWFEADEGPDAVEAGTGAPIRVVQGHEEFCPADGRDAAPTLRQRHRETQILASRTRFEQRWQSAGRDVGFRLRENLRFAMPLPQGWFRYPTSTVDFPPIGSSRPMKARTRSKPARVPQSPRPTPARRGSRTSILKSGDDPFGTAPGPSRRTSEDLRPALVPLRRARHAGLRIPVSIERRD
jgi:hypothetical protein